MLVFVLVLRIGDQTKHYAINDLIGQFNAGQGTKELIPCRFLRWLFWRGRLAILRKTPFFGFDELQISSLRHLPAPLSSENQPIAA